MRRFSYAAGSQLFNQPAGIRFETTAEQAKNMVTDVTALACATIPPIRQVTFGSTTSPRQRAITLVHLGF